MPIFTDERKPRPRWTSQWVRPGPQLSRCPTPRAGADPKGQAKSLYLGPVASLPACHTMGFLWLGAPGVQLPVEKLAWEGEAQPTPLPYRPMHI